MNTPTALPPRTDRNDALDTLDRLANDVFVSESEIRYLRDKVADLMTTAEAVLAADDGDDHDRYTETCDRLRTAIGHARGTA